MTDTLGHINPGINPGINPDINSLSKVEQTNTVYAAVVADFLVKNGWFLATAESCTGGMIAAACTDLAGSSAWFERGFVTYSNAAKVQMLDVDAGLIAVHGAVSEPVARAMALGAVRHSAAQVSVAVTGVAGPTGGSAAKPVGTVWLAWCVGGNLYSEVKCFGGNRADVRLATVSHALGKLVSLLGNATPRRPASTLK